MKITLSDSFYPLLENKAFYLILCGGRGSGKSEFAGRKIFYRCQKEGNHRFLIMRKVRARTKESVIEVMLRILAENNINYSYNKSDRIVVFYSVAGQKNELLFDGLDDPDKIKSIKGITGVWLEETTEFTKKDFDLIDLSLREPSPFYKQIIMSFNPDEARGPWIKEKFFDEKQPDSFVHVSTVEDNPIAEIREDYLKRLDRIDDEALKEIFRYGRWALVKGIIFNWDVVAKPDGEFYDEYFYGLDFGYSVDPAAVVKIYRKADEFWVEQMIYNTGLTNIDLGDMMIAHSGIDISAPIYCDSAEPKSIEELYRMEINVFPASKGPDSVRAGIDFMKNAKIHIIEGSDKIVEERSKYKYKEDKDGNPLPVPVEFDNHAMDAIRYGIFTHMKEYGEGMYDITVI